MLAQTINFNEGRETLYKWEINLNYGRFFCEWGSF
jgi:hypothetical protein